MRRISLKDGGTKRRELIHRRLSCQTKASLKGNAVKKEPTDGTSSFSFELL
jgi:hypothetical protein